MHKATSKHRNSRSAYDLYADYATIKEALADATEDVKGRASEILAKSLQDVKDKSLNTKENIEGYVAEKPFKTIGLSMLVGGIIGFLLHK